MKKSKSSQSKKKQLPKLKKYYEGGYSNPQGTFDSNGIMVAGPMGLPTNSPIQPKGSAVGNIVAGVDSVKKDSRKFNSYPVYQKIVNPDGTPTYWGATAKMSPEDFHSSSRGSDIKEFKGAAPIDEQTYIANKGTFNMMPDYSRHAYGGKKGGPDDPRKRLYDIALEKIDWDSKNPEAWKGDPDMTNADGSYKFCVDCVNVDYSKKEDVEDVIRLINEGKTSGPHYNADAYAKALKNFNMTPTPTKAYGGIHKYKPGGKVAKDIAAGLYGAGEGVLDTVTFGATDKLTDMGYKALQKAGGSSEDEIREQDSIHGYGQAAGAVGGGFINPAATGNAIAQAGEGLGEGVSRGNESKENAQTAGMLLNTAGKIGGMAYGMAGSPMTAGMESQSSNFNNSNFGGKLNKYNEIAGQAGAFMQNGGMYRHGGMKHPHMPHFSSFPPAPSGMYGTQLAYGGEQPNAEVEGGPNSQEAITPSDGRMPQVFGGGGLEQVSENPYGKPTYMTTRDSNTHEQADSNGQTGVPVNLSPGTAISSNKTKNPMTNRPFLKDLLKITNKEKKHSDILTNKDSTPSDINTARVVLPMLAKAKENFEKYMAAVVQNKEQAKQLKKGIIPSTDNEQAEPRSMSEQSEGEMAAARHGGMYANGGKLPQSLLKARLESHMSPEEANDYIANYKSGGIHIKPENRGKFTAYKKRTGKTTEEALHSPNAHVRQMANFARNAAKWKHEMGGMQRFDGGGTSGGHSDATGSYDSQGNMIAGPMGEILNDDQYRNAVIYGDAWNSSKPWGTTTQEQTDYMNDVINSYDKNVKNKTAANANVAAQPVVTSATPVSQPSAFDPKKGQWINGKWVLFDVPSTLAHSTPEGTFNATGEQTSSTYGRPMMQTFDPIQPALTDKDQAEKDLQNSYKNVPSSIGELKSPKDYSNYADYARQAAIFTGQNLGNIRDFVKTKGGKEFDKENYGQMTPQMPDYSEAKRAALNEAAAYRKMLPGLTGGNAGATLGMMGQMQGMSQEQAAKIMEAEQQARTGVYNQFLPLNKQLQMQERADTQANKARSEDIARMAVKGLSENIGGAGSDYGMSKRDQETLAIISNSYPDYAYDKKKKGWYHKTSKEKLDPSKVKPKS